MFSINGGGQYCAVSGNADLPAVGVTAEYEIGSAQIVFRHGKRDRIGIMGENTVEKRFFFRCFIIRKAGFEVIQPEKTDSINGNGFVDQRQKGGFLQFPLEHPEREPGDTALVPVAVDGQFQPARQRFEEVDSCIETADVADQIAAEQGVIRLKFFRFP